MSTLKVNNLQVGQDATASNNFTLYQPAVPDGTVRLGVGNSGSVTDTLTVSGGNIGIGTNPSSLKLAVYNSSVTSSVYVDTSGRILVGTIAPVSSSSEKLTVSSGMTLLSNNSDSVAPLYLRNENFTANTNQPYITFQDGFGNRAGFGVDNNASALWMSAQNGIRFRGGTTSPGNTEWMRISDDGNVGIGQTNPQSKLTINGSTESVSVNISGTQRLTLGADGSWNYFRGKSGNGHYFNTTGGALFTISNSGTVGIGTADATNRYLQIYGDNPRFMVRDNAATSNFGDCAIEFGNLNHYPTAFISHAWNGTNGQLSFHTRLGGNEYQRVTINSDGNVGIGTTNPNSKLDVRGDTVFYGRRTSYPNSTGVVSREYSGNGAPVTGHTPAVFRHVRYIDVTSSGNQLRIPIVYQGNYNTHTLMHIRGSSARYNNRDPLYFDVKIAIGHLTILSNMSVYDQNGNISSITTTTGTDANNPHYININFTNDYTSGTLDGLYLWLEYFTAVENSSILVDGIYLN